MHMKISDLWRWRGEIDRVPFVLWSVLLVAAKILADRAIVDCWHGTRFTLRSYVQSDVLFGSGLNLPQNEILAISLVSLLFLWPGLGLTIRRLRAAGLHPALSICFFIPYVKLALFAALALVPHARAPHAPGRPGALGRFIPQGRRSAVVAVLLTALLGAAGVAIGTLGFRNYGWSLFMGLPFFYGMATSLLYGYHQSRKLGECLALCVLSLLVCGGVLVLVALEGIICIVMAAPLIGGIAILGAFVGWMIQAESWKSFKMDPPLALAIFLVPGSMTLEHALPSSAPLIRVCSAIEIDAPPEAVWKNVVEFSELPEPREWIFKTGLAYPIRAEIQGRGVGAIRTCCFNTGNFVEPIEAWDEPRLLAFGVTQNPPPMRESSLYKNLNPPHLHGFMVSERGQFLLTDLGNGRTKLEGTTWYHHGLWPAAYWQVWSDAIIHRIHLRVLNHVKQLSETDAARA